MGLPADQAVPVFGTMTNWYFYVFVMVLIMIPQILINIYGIRLTARLNDFSVYWHIGGVAIIALLLTVFGTHHNSLDFLFSRRHGRQSARRFLRGPRHAARLSRRWCSATSSSPRRSSRSFPWLAEVYRAAPFALVFVLALLQAQWTYTGYDASAHVAEETVMARKNSAWGVFLSVAVSAVVGYVMLLILTWCIPNGDVAATANDAYPVLQIVYGNLGVFFANVVAIIIGVAMWLCGSSSITSMARMWYAFARDDGMPGSSLIKRVSPTYRTPVWSILITSALAVRAVPLCGGVLRGHVDQHDHALPGLHVPDLSQLAEPAAGAGRVHHGGDGAVESRGVGPGAQRDRDRVGAVPDGDLQPAAQRAGAVDDAGAGGGAGALLAGVGQADLRRADPGRRAGAATFGNSGGGGCLKEAPAAG